MRCEIHAPWRPWLRSVQLDPPFYSPFYSVWSFVWRARFGLRLSSRVESRHESTWDLGHDSDTRQESQAQRGEDTQNTSRARVTESQTETIVHTAESTHGETDGASFVSSLSSGRRVTSRRDRRQTSHETRDRESRLSTAPPRHAMRRARRPQTGRSPRGVPIANRDPRSDTGSDCAVVFSSFSGDSTFVSLFPFALFIFWILLTFC